jgi:hypothetical protein
MKMEFTTANFEHYKPEGFKQGGGSESVSEAEDDEDSAS